MIGCVVPKVLLNSWPCHHSHEDSFHAALGMMGIADQKHVKQTCESLKMPPLEKPQVFGAAVDAIMAAEPPFVGPQVPHLKLTTTNL